MKTVKWHRKFLAPYGVTTSSYEEAFIHLPSIHYEGDYVRRINKWLDKRRKVRHYTFVRKFLGKKIKGNRHICSCTTLALLLRELAADDKKWQRQLEKLKATKV